MMPWFLVPELLRFIHFPPMPCYYDLRFRKDSRYYVMRLGKDLLNDWVLTLINGRIKSKLGQSRTLALGSFDDCFDHLCSLANQRCRRAYILETFASDNHLMLHLMLCVLNTENKLQDEKVILQNPQRKAAREIKGVKQLPTQQLGFAF